MSTSDQSQLIGVYPGSFNPPTLAHLAIANQARRDHGLARVELSVSTVALAKEAVSRPLFEHRIEVLEAVADTESWLSVRVTKHQLLVDVAEGYDLLIMGADKWHQIHELKWYANDPAVRDAAIAALPPVAVASRDQLGAPDDVALGVDPAATTKVSSTRARQGALELLPEPARAFALATGAWIDAERYEQWLTTGRKGRRGNR